jgi:hypothetical protein
MDHTYALRSDISLHELQEILNRLWTESRNDPVVMDMVRQQGVDPATLQNYALSARLSGGGFDAATTAVIVSFAPVAAKVVSDLWEKIILPKLRRAKGTDALTPKNEGVKER